MSLPYFQGDSQPMSLMQTSWKQYLDPLLKNALSKGVFLNGISLTAAGPNVINHMLGRTMQGWILSDINAAASVFRSAAFNDLTLTLTTSADCKVSIYAF